LVARFEPAYVSEHLRWRSVDGRFYNDLLPLPCTREALAHVSSRIVQVQERLGRQIAVENVSSCLEFGAGEFSEWEFLAALVKASGCALLLDVNNVYVSAVNHGFDPLHYVDSLPGDAVVEIHRAGFTRREVDGALMLDRHPRCARRAGSPVAVRPRDPTFRPASDADRMGGSAAAARHAAAGGPPGGLSDGTRL
jgi:uncharacterized protein (UPF0276 family)